MSKRLKYILSFVGLILVQVLILNNLQLFGYLNPKVYPLFILLLPQKTNKALLLSLAFVMGLIIDSFENSGGIHASALVFLAFIRPLFIKIVTSAGSSTVPGLSIKHLGIAKFLSYMMPAIFIHHLWLFSLEAFTFRNYDIVLFETAISSLFSIILILTLELLFNRRAET